MPRVQAGPASMRWRGLLRCPTYSIRNSGKPIACRFVFSGSQESQFLFFQFFSLLKLLLLTFTIFFFLFFVLIIVFIPFYAYFAWSSHIYKIKNIAQSTLGQTTHYFSYTFDDFNNRNYMNNANSHGNKMMISLSCSICVMSSTAYFYSLHVSFDNGCFFSYINPTLLHLWRFCACA